MRRSLVAPSARGRWLLAAALALSTQAGWAADCTVGSQGVSFGSYDVFSAQSLDGVGTISLSCDESVEYTLSLSAGGGSYASRAMASGANTLAYNLYIDATYTAIWGDGTGNTATVSSSGTAADHTIYGRIPARQNVAVGSYSDTITVEIEF